MNILLIQVDGKLPNLALMKLSAHHKQKGDNVGFNVSNPDVVYASVIFAKHYANAKGIKLFYPDADFHLGGSALDIPNYLPNEIEHMMPDYSLYPKLNYSMGFTTRGCFRKCEFCIVPKIEGKFREHANIEEFHNPDFNKVMLLDNNILASKKLYKTISFIKDNDLKVCISQGMDARLVTKKTAETLASIKSYNQSFKIKSYIFAWDNIKDEKNVLKGLNKMIDAGIKPKHIMVYVLVGFDSNYWDDIYRLDTLSKIGVCPYVMIYNFKRNDKILNAIAKWANRRYYTVCELRQFVPFKKHLEKGMLGETK